MSIEVIDKLRDIIPEDSDVYDMYEDHERFEMLREAVRVLYYELRK